MKTGSNEHHAGTTVMPRAHAGFPHVKLLWFVTLAFVLGAGDGGIGSDITVAGASELGPTVRAHPFLRKWNALPLAESRAAAKAGDASAQYYLGWACLCGMGIAPDPAEALRWFRQAAEKGVPEAEVKVGLLYELGIATPQDFPGAMKWYEKSAAKGSVGAQVRLGMIHGGRANVPRVTVISPGRRYTGPAVGKDLPQARKWLSLAAEQGYPPAQVLLSELLQLNTFTPPVVRPLTTTNRTGFQSQPVEPSQPDRVEPVKWFFVAAVRGDALARRATNVFQSLLTHGQTDYLHLKADDIKEAKRQAEAFLAAHPAKDWTHVTEVLFPFNPFALPAGTNSGISQFDRFLSAARNGDPAAQYALALYFQHDDYNWNLMTDPSRFWPPSTIRFPEEKDQAIPARTRLAGAWYTAAAAQDHVASMVNLGFMYANGRFGDNKQANALEWFSRAAKRGQAEAQFQLGRMYQEGKGVAANFVEAVKLYRAAAAQGHSGALQALGSSRPSALPESRAARLPSPAAGAAQSPAAGAAGKAVRLAIVPADPSLRAATDVLTALLSQQSDLQLLERSEIDRVFQELALASSSQKDFLKLGQILGADGLLTLESAMVDQKRRLQLTLAAVGPGVVLASEPYPLPLEDLPGWSTLVAKQLKFLFPKLAVTSADAVPVSILNLRSPISTAEAVVLDRELTVLLTHRLVREKELFVLERRRMDALEREKQFQGKERAAFWNGSYLLDGTVNKEGITQGTVTISGRLVPPEGGEGKIVEVSGRRDQLPRLADELAGKILNVLHKQPQITAWDPLDEAARYFEEARWGLRWGMFKEAQAASESSWALGVRLPELATIRVRAYGEDTRTDTGKWTSLQDGRMIVEKAPAPQKLASALRALELYLDYTRHQAGDGKLDLAWHTLGVEQLESASELLKHYYHFPGARETARDQLAELRSRARDLGRLLEKVAELQKNSSSSGIGAVIFRYGSYWQETPEDVLALQRVIIEQGWHRRSSPLDQPRSPMSSRLITWNPADEGRVAGLKRDFFEQLCQSTSQSTNVMLRLEALLMRVKASESDYAFESNLPPFLDALWANREQLFANGPWPPVWAEARMMLASPRNGHLSDFWKRLSEETCQPFLKRMDAAIPEIVRKAQGEQQRKDEDPVRQALRHQLQTATTIDFTAFFQQFVHLDFTPEEAKELLPLLQAYQKRLGMNGRHAMWLEQKLLRKTPGQAAPIPVAAPAVAAPAAPNLSPEAAAMKEALTGPNPGGRVLPTASSAVIVDRFWSIPLKSTRARLIDEVTIRAVELQQNRFWVQVNFEERSSNNSGSRRRTAVFSLDPSTSASDIIEVPPSGNASFAPPSPAVAPRQFAVHGDYLFAPVEFAPDDARFEKYSRRTRAWQRMKASWPLATRFFSAQGRLYLSTPDSILEMDPETEAVKVLASARRRPPETILDQLPELASPLLFAGPRGSLRTLVENKVYSYNPTTRKWAEVTSIAGAAFRAPHPFWFAEVQGSTLLVHHDPGEGNKRTLALHEDGSIFQTLYVSRPHLANVMSGQPNQAESAVWDAPVDLHAARMPHRVEGHNLWVLADASKFQTDALGNPPADGTLSATATLLCFQEGNKTPLAVPVCLRIPVETAKASPGQRVIGTGWHFPTSIEVSPKTITIVCDGVPGVWLIPRTLLKPRLEEVAKTAKVEEQIAKAKEQEFMERVKKFPDTYLFGFDRNHNRVLDADELEEIRRTYQPRLSLPRLAESSLPTSAPAGTTNRVATAERPAKAVETAPMKAAEPAPPVELSDIAALLADPVKAKANKVAIRRSLEKAAQGGDVDAQVRLIKFLLNPPGSGVIETENALYWAKKAIAAGRTEVHADIGWAYLNALFAPTAGEGTPFSPAVESSLSQETERKAFQWLQKGTELGNAGSEAGLGMLLLHASENRRNPVEGRRLIQKAAEAGNAVGQRLLGMLLEGELNGGESDAGTKPNYEQAAAWYRKAADQEDREAMCHLGRLYYRKNIPDPAAEALTWLQKSWDHGYANALLLLAEMYEKGSGKPRNPDEQPVAIYRRFVSWGYLDQAIKVAKAFRHGRGVARDPFWAALYYIDALKVGDQEARAVFGMLDPQMRPRPQRSAAEREFAEELSLVCRALALEDVGARVQIANQHLKKNEVGPTNTVACTWFRLAGKRGDAQALARGEELYGQLSEYERRVVDTDVELLEVTGNFLNGLRKK